MIYYAEDNWPPASMLSVYDALTLMIAFATLVAIIIKDSKKIITLRTQGNYQLMLLT